MLATRVCGRVHATHIHQHPTAHIRLSQLELADETHELTKNPGRLSRMGAGVSSSHKNSKVAANIKDEGNAGERSFKLRENIRPLPPSTTTPTSNVKPQSPAGSNVTIESLFATMDHRSSNLLDKSNITGVSSFKRLFKSSSNECHVKVCDMHVREHFRMAREARCMQQTLK